MTPWHKIYVIVDAPCPYSPDFICDTSAIRTVQIDAMKLFDELEYIHTAYNFVLIDRATMAKIADFVPDKKVWWIASGIYYEYSPRVAGIYTTMIKHPEDMVVF